MASSQRTPNFYTADGLAPRLAGTQTEWATATEQALVGIAFVDDNGTHRLVFHSDGSGAPPREIVYLGYNDKGWSIDFEWTYTADGWVANTTHETVFEYNEPVAEHTTTYSGGGGGSGPGDVQQQTLNVLANKLAGSLSRAKVAAALDRATNAAPTPVQIATSCGAEAAPGFMDIATFGLNRTMAVRNATGGYGFPSTPPAGLTNQQATWNCIEALVRAGYNHAAQQVTYIGTTLATQAISVMWDLSSAAQSAGTLFQGSLTGGSGSGADFTNAACSQWIDQVTCNILGQPSQSHPF